MANKRKKDAFMIQAAILAAAGFISRIIGLLYAVPLYQIIGEEGNGYYGTAYEIYYMILLISTYSIPTAVSKVISQKLAVSEYRNAKKLFTCSLVYVVVVGLFAATVTFVLAPVLVIDEAVLSLRVMAPTIFFSGLLSVFRGYMQAYNTMVPTAISQIIEQVMNAIISIAAAYIFTLPFRDGNSLDLAVHGAAGSALGTGAGVLTGLAFILVIYAKKRKSINETIVTDNCTNEESYKQLFKMIFMMVTPIILATFVYNIFGTVNMKIYWWIMGLKDVNTSEASSIFGIYTRQYVVLMNVPVAIGSAISAALVPAVSGAYSKGDMSQVKSKVNQAFSTAMMIAIPAFVGMSVLAEPIMQLLFRGTTKNAAYSVMGGSIAICFATLSTLSNGALQAIGKVNYPVKNSALALVINIIVISAALYFTNGRLSVLVGCHILYTGVICILNARTIRKVIDYRMSFKNHFLIPGVAASVMGIVTYLVYYGLHAIIGSNIFCIGVSVTVAVLVYAVVILKIGNYSEQQIIDMPKGTTILKLARKLRIIK